MNTSRHQIKPTFESAARQIAEIVKTNDQAWSEACLLLAHILKKNRTWILAHGEVTISPTRLKLFKQLIARRLRHEPIAYLIGRVLFCGREFLTDKRALIPRPETEYLVTLASEKLKTLDTQEKVLVWDVGTGCGAIAISIKSDFPIADVIASDADTRALALAKKNHSALLKNRKMLFLKADLLDQKIKKQLTSSSAKCIFVLANLPYLPLSDKKVLAPDVVKFEPSHALFTKENGNLLIHRLLKQLAVFRLTDERPLTILCEFDPPQANTLRSLAINYFPDATIKVHTDSCGRERILEVETPDE